MVPKSNLDETQGIEFKRTTINMFKDVKDDMTKTHTKQNKNPKQQWKTTNNPAHPHTHTKENLAEHKEGKNKLLIEVQEPTPTQNQLNEMIKPSEHMKTEFTCLVGD